MSDFGSKAISPLPKRLKEARLTKGLSQKNLGILAGIDEFSASSRMNQYERGKHVPDFRTLKSLAGILEVPTAYFYCEEEWLAESVKKLYPLSASDRKLIFDESNRK